MKVNEDNEIWLYGKRNTVGKSCLRYQVLHRIIEGRMIGKPRGRRRLEMLHDLTQTVTAVLH